ncbi:sulfite exporter TauE/SafE family protein [Marinomonas transparens]|uniref:Probable membrane transporter protein n=1 Tax=Marinomonas transparens TaxID=2795388 RepID=A0A934MZF1_9GAMM|nr:TSUP family transporter [Marinomonas transparens]MBJ7537475.1 TSUP family transporter [Marinomonas transparens]
MVVDLFALGFFSFCGGLIDAAVGGGGLLLMPALLHALPEHTLTTVFGTNKMAVWAGTLSSIFRYVKRVKLVWKIMIPTAFAAFLFSYLGAKSIAFIPKDIMQVAVFFLLVVMAIYTFVKKDLGKTHKELKINHREIAKGVIFGGLIGYYDGVFGPGSGSFLIFLFVRGFGFDFLNASASAKLINMGTFTAALLFFIPSGNVLWEIGILVAACNILGAIVGVFLALRYGSEFIRIVFLVLLVFLIGRMGLGMV